MDRYVPDYIMSPRWGMAQTNVPGCTPGYVRLVSTEDVIQLAARRGLCNMVRAAAQANRQGGGCGAP